MTRVIQSIEFNKFGSFNNKKGNINNLIIWKIKQIWMNLLNLS